MKMSGEIFEVDWAALAQQWIKMKETAIPPAPPPPSIAHQAPPDGGGEAPMDMDLKDDDIPLAPPPPTISNTDDWNQWNQWGAQWSQNNSTQSTNWDWSVAPIPTPRIPNVKTIGDSSIPSSALIPPPAPTISNTPAYVNQCARPNLSSLPPIMPPSFAYNSLPMPQLPYNSQIPPAGFWENEPIPSLVGPHGSSDSEGFIKNHRPNNRNMQHNVNVINNSTIPQAPSSEEKSDDDQTTFVLDSAKRRQLPAWIREGLEKMEREKQKAIEREQQELLRKQELEERKKAQEQARAVLNPSKSKFDSDSEKDDDKDDPEEVEEEPEEINNDSEKKLQINDSSQMRSPEELPQRKSRFRDAESSGTDSPASTQKDNTKDNNATETYKPNTPPQLSKEEQLQNLMLKVRRALTEILLEVTNDEIGAICTEVWKRFKSKASTGGNSNHSSNNTAPLAQITRKLGLGIYGDSNSESEEEPSFKGSTPPKEETDSEEELKEMLWRRKQAFRRTEEEIEARIAREEEAEQNSDSDDEKIGNTPKLLGSVPTRSSDGGSSVESEKRRPMDKAISKNQETHLKKESSKGNSSCFEEVEIDKDNNSRRPSNCEKSEKVRVASRSNILGSENFESRKERTSSESDHANQKHHKTHTYNDYKNHRVVSDRSSENSRSTQSKRHRKSNSRDRSSSSSSSGDNYKQSRRRRNKRTRSRDSRSISRVSSDRDKRTRSRSRNSRKKRRTSKHRVRSRSRGRRSRSRQSRRSGSSRRRNSRSRSKSRRSRSTSTSNSNYHSSHRYNRHRDRDRRDGKKSSRHYRD